MAARNLTDLQLTDAKFLAAMAELSGYATKHYRRYNEANFATFSPFALFIILVLFIHDSTGPASSKLLSLLGYDANTNIENDIATRCGKLLEYYALIFGYNKPTCIFFFNKLLKSKNYNLPHSCAVFARKFLSLVVEEIDFDSKSVVNDVNKRIKEQTHHRIEMVVDNFNSNSKIVVLCTCSMKIKFTNRFDFRETVPKSFCNYNNNSQINMTNVPMMCGKTLARYGETVLGNIKFRILELECGNRISVCYCLPSDTKYAGSLLNGVNLESLQQLCKSTREELVEVSIPKIEHLFRAEISDIFKDIGALDATKDQKTAGEQGSSYWSELLNVYHVIKVDLSEEDSRAESNLKDKTANIVFEANRPFLYTIIDKHNSMVLVVGQVIRIE